MNIHQHGFGIVKKLIPQTLIDRAKEELSSVDQINNRAGIRNAEKKYATIREIVHSNSVMEKASEILKDSAKVVRVIYFDKTPEKNWFVTWHQDKTVALSRRHDLSGWEPWTLKDGTHHVQPPLEVLNNMVTFRIHLDASDESNGCLNVFPCSHQHGILKQNEINLLAEKQKPFPCIVDAGDTLVMRPHIVHCSGKAEAPNHRRVIHVEFSCFELPENVHWA